MKKFTHDEKRAVGAYLDYNLSPKKFWWDIAPYLGPSMAFSVFALWEQNFGALVLAHLIFLVLALWYLFKQNAVDRHFHSAVCKYEDEVRALEKPNDDDS